MRPSHWRRISRGQRHYKAIKNWPARAAQQRVNKDSEKELFSLKIQKLISFPLLFLADEQVFPLTKGAAGLHNNLLPLDQLENDSAYEIQYTVVLHQLP